MVYISSRSVDIAAADRIGSAALYPTTQALILRSTAILNPCMIIARRGLRGTALDRLTIDVALSTSKGCFAMGIFYPADRGKLYFHFQNPSLLQIFWNGY
jgi:hypothetical protein